MDPRYDHSPHAAPKLPMLKPFLFTFSALLGSLTGSTAGAQSSDASRYVNREGIEVIQGRQPGTPDGRVMPPVRTDSSSKNNPAGVRPAAAPATGQAARDPRLQVSASEQGERDRDRLGILNQELMTEAEAFQVKWKILHNPGMRAKLSDEELARVQETMHADELNIRALNAEIIRVRSSQPPTAQPRAGAHRMQ